MPRTRGTIAFLTSDYAEYSRVVGDAVGVAANAAGYGILSVTGRELAHASDGTTDQSVCNGIYRLIERVDLAGVISESGTLGHRSGPEAVVRFLTRFRVPCVSVGLDVPGTASVVIDDELGMRRLMEHLVTGTARRRFAFVRGLDGDMYSAEREGIFRETLARHGHEIDERLFVTGNYDMFDAYEAVARLLRDRLDIDAIVAANDMMALSAARAVSAAGLNIPRDIVVSGFDDVPDATRISPALTTVRQPMAEAAELAIVKLLELIADTPPGTTPVVPAEGRVSRVDSELVVRGSTVSATPRAGDGKKVDAEGLHRLLTAGMIGLRVPEGLDLRALASAFARTITHGSPSLADRLALAATGIGQADTHWWSNLCHQIEELSRQLLGASGQASRLPLVEAALSRVRERIWASEMEREFSARRIERLRSMMQLQIGSSSDLEEIVNAVDKWADAFEPRRFFLVRYDRPAAEPASRGRLIRALRHGTVESLSDETLATRNLLPASLAVELGRGTLLLAPVHAGSDHFGYLLIDPEGLDLSQTDAAARSIGNALRNQYLRDALESQAARLRSANAELSALANRDALTGLPNRLCFEHRLRDLCERDGEAGRFALCFLDLDGFKPINDTLGHETGDLLLQSVGGRLERVVADVVGERGFVSRLGGDEFTVIVDSGSPAEDLGRLAPVLLEELSAGHRLAGHTVHVSASIGGVLCPDHGSEAGTLLKRADAAMYEAKALGKNGFVLHATADGVVSPMRFTRDRDEPPDEDFESGSEFGRAAVAGGRRGG